MMLTQCVMTPEPNLWGIVGSAAVLIAASVVWLAPVLLAGLVTWVSETLRDLPRPSPRRPTRRRRPLSAHLPRRAATSTSP